MEPNGAQTSAASEVGESIFLSAGALISGDTFQAWVSMLCVSVNCHLPEVNLFKAKSKAPA